MLVTIANVDKALFQEKTYLVVLPSIKGEIGIMHNHSLLACKLVFGVIKMCSAYDKIDKKIFINGGLAYVNNSSVIVVCNYALAEKDVADGLELNDQKLIEFYQNINKYLHKNKLAMENA